MNRTERAILRSQKEAKASSNRQKNDTIRRQRKMIKAKDPELNRAIKHLGSCIKKDRAAEKGFMDDVKLYKERFAVQKKEREVSVA